MDPVVALRPNCYLRGKVVRAVGNLKPIYAFLGIPYAEPPVGDLRFKHTQPIRRYWKGTRDATEFGSICPQNSVRSASFYGPFPIPDNHSEDCLYLNVWTPTIGKDLEGIRKRPVVVYIHGGAYQNGFSNMHNGTAHATFEDVVFVSINYRLGAFGFLYTGDGIAPGNMGITDVIEAFVWVQKHISVFGGDPDNVTCMGESAGGFLVTLVMIIARGRGLYHKAISQSGVSTDSMVWTATQAKSFFIKRLQRRGYPRGSIGNMDSFMKNITKEELIRIYDGGTVPIIDGNLIKEHPRTSFLHGRTESVPFLVGLTSSEGFGFATGHVLSSNENKDQKLSTKLIEKAVNSLLMELFRRAAREKGVDKLLLEEYRMYDEECITRNKDFLIQQFSEMTSDAMFGAPVIFAAVCHSAHSPVFLFEFDQRPPGIPDQGWVRSQHADDLPYTIGYPFLEAPHPYNKTTPETFDDNERRFCRNVMRFWSNFARLGNPNEESSVFWPNFTSQDQKYIVLNKDTCHVKRFYQKEKMELWNKHIFPLLGFEGIASKF